MGGFKDNFDKGKFRKGRNVSCSESAIVNGWEKEDVFFGKFF